MADFGVDIRKIRTPTRHKEILVVNRPANLPKLSGEWWIGITHITSHGKVRLWTWQASTFGHVLNGLVEPHHSAACLALNILKVYVAPQNPDDAAIVRHQRARAMGMGA